MTLGFIENYCSLDVNIAWGVSLETRRKLLYTEIFFIFFVYFTSQVLHAFRYKNAPISLTRSSVHN
jgi:hypothetical protein